MLQNMFLIYKIACYYDKDMNFYYSDGSGYLDKDGNYFLSDGSGYYDKDMKRKIL